MANQNYFTSSAANPVELAEKNLTFYDEFVATWGCSASHRHLWLGQDLATFIYSFIIYATQSGNEVVIRKAKQLETDYTGLYNRLTGYPYMITSPKSNIATT